MAMLSVYNQIVFDLIGNDKRQEDDINPFSFKNFLSDDLASRNKRVLQVNIYLLRIIYYYNRNTTFSTILQQNLLRCHVYISHRSGVHVGVHYDLVGYENWHCVVDSILPATA